MTPEDLKAALADHALWRRGEGGKRLVLSGLDLRGAIMTGADLSRADLRSANLRDTDLLGAVLRGTDLRDTDLTGARLADVDLTYAVMDRADLRGANLRGAIGNMREIKSAHFDLWPVTWVTDPDKWAIVQIGCERHPLELWEKADPRWLAKMETRAIRWADKYLALVCQLVRASPAVPYGRAAR